MAKALAGVLPPMSREEALITSKIYSVAGKADRRGALVRERPFRSPHISASKPAILGGGSGENILPGEVSLASGGVLFLDEFCEAPKSTLEALRAPLEDRQVTIARLKAKIVYPASFMLVAASNPCPCGYYGEGDRCICSPAQRAQYLSKLSGPMMDRIDLQLWVHPVDTAALVRGGKGEPSAAIAARVMRAREIQERRFAGSGIFTNTEMGSKELEAYCPLSPNRPPRPFRPGLYAHHKDRPHHRRPRRSGRHPPGASFRSRLLQVFGPEKSAGVVKSLEFDIIFSIFAMSTKDKLIERFKSLPSNFTFDELKVVMSRCGFIMQNQGATSGSRIAFTNGVLAIKMHKPHPSKIVGRKTLKSIKDFLTDNQIWDD